MASTSPRVTRGPRRGSPRGRNTGASTPGSGSGSSTTGSSLLRAQRSPPSSRCSAPAVASGTGEELRSEFVSTVGGVMTEEAGAVTGDLELLTRPAEVGALEALVRYAGAEEWYTVSGSPLAK